MKRWFALLAAVLMLAMCMTACKSEEEKALDELEDAVSDFQDELEDLLG